MGTGIESIHSTGSARTAITSSVHGVLAARLTRRILALAGAAAVPAAALLALACPPLASTALAGTALAGTALAGTAMASPALAGTAQAGTASVVIDSMTPQTARPGDTVTVSGTVSNRTSQTEAGLVVYLMSSAARFTTRDQMDGYLSLSGSPSLEAVGNPFSIAASLRPGATAQWHASFEVNNVGITEFGVYPVSAELNDQAGDVLGTDQTLLPFWPGQQAAGLQRPLAISWVWPLIDQPHHQVCTTADNAPVSALTSNALAASLSPGGRLSDLLTAGQAHADADLTWVVDPALLSDVAAMTRPYRAGSGLGCIGVTAEPASKAAATWLAGLQAITAVQPTVITPYANVDVSALVHHGFEAGLTRAYTAGRTVADDVLHGSFGPSIALPAGGTADLSVLTNLAASQDIDTVVLSSSQLPSASTSVFEPDDAVTSVRAAGTTVTVLLADSVLTNVLQAGASSPGTPATQFAVSQRFLAETAMIAAEAPDSDRSVVVEPPESWSPSAALADQLLSETVNTPWLTPTPLGNLARIADSDRGIARQPLAGSAVNPAELSPRYLETVAAAEASLSTYEAMLDRPSAAYLQSLNQALTAAESAAWRGGGAAQGIALADGLSAYLADQVGKVTIITAPQVQMGGASGPVPVSIQNGSSLPIQVKLAARVINGPGRTSQLTIGNIQKLITVPPKQAVTVRLPVSSAPPGSTEIKLSLTTAKGAPLPVQTVSFTILSTRYGRAILFLIAAAIGVLVLTSVYRGVRRWLRADTQVATENEDLPGSVVTSTAGARPPTEKPDDLADARRWVDDT
jgi:Family of unknown function (DUF6049)